FVKANVQNRQEEVLLRTYDGDDLQLLSENISVIDAVKSTLVAFGQPGIFPSSLLPNKLDQSYKDIERHDKSNYGGPLGLQSSPLRPELDWNNPIYDVYREARTIWPDRYIQITSIGHNIGTVHGPWDLERRFAADYSETRGLALSRFEPRKSYDGGVFVSEERLIHEDS
ncbi:MAG: hypothetical protein Q9164_007473, partial [Protoblastenia rupestris]